MAQEFKKKQKSLDFFSFIKLFNHKFGGFYVCPSTHFSLGWLHSPADSLHIEGKIILEAAGARGVHSSCSPEREIFCPPYPLWTRTLWPCLSESCARFWTHHYHLQTDDTYISDRGARSLDGQPHSAKPLCHGSGVWRSPKHSDRNVFLNWAGLCRVSSGKSFSLILRYCTGSIFHIQIPPYTLLWIFLSHILDQVPVPHSGEVGHSPSPAASPSLCCPLIHPSWRVKERRGGKKQTGLGYVANAVLWSYSVLWEACV